MKRYLLLAMMLLRPAFVQGQDIEFRILSNLPNDQILYTGRTNIIELTGLTGSVVVKAKHGLIKMMSKSTFAILSLTGIYRKQIRFLSGMGGLSGRPQYGIRFRR